MNALLDAFLRYMPTAAEEPPVEAKHAKTGAPATITPDPAGPLVARVFKTAADPFVGRLTYPYELVELEHAHVLAADLCERFLAEHQIDPRTAL